MQPVEDVQPLLISSPDANQPQIFEVAISQDHQWLAAVTVDSQILVWSIGEDAVEFHGVIPMDLALSDPAIGGRPPGDAGIIIVPEPDIQISIWSECSDEQGDRDDGCVPILAVASESGAVDLWSLESMQYLESVLGCSESDRYRLAFSPDGQWLAAAGITVCLWNLVDPERPVQLQGHSAPVTELKFERNSASLFSGSADTTVRKWTIADIVEEPVVRDLDVSL